MLTVNFTIFAVLALGYVVIARPLARRRARTSATRSAALAAIDQELADNRDIDVGELIDATLARAATYAQRARDASAHLLVSFSLSVAIAEIATALGQYRRSDDPSDDLLRARTILSDAMHVAADAEAARAGRRL